MTHVPLQSSSVAPPASPNLWVPLSARIVAIRPEAPGISTYDLALDDPDAAACFRFQPGQFNMLYLPGYGESAISISSDAEQPERISHTIRVAGNVTRALARLKAGDRMGLRGPFGTPWPLDDCRGADLVIACGGVGLAPLRPAICHVLRHRDQFGRVHLLYGARTPRDLLFTAEFQAWREAGIEVQATVDLGDGDWSGPIGVVPMLFYRLRLAGPRTRVFTCGPEIMMRFVVFESLAHKVRPEHIHLSMERNMNCAVGLCGHCQFGPHFVCKDGPVFTYRELEPFMHLEDF